MIRGILIGVVFVVLIVVVYIGYRMGASDQKYERDTGRDFASNRDKDFGGEHYGGGYNSGRYGRPRTRSYDDDPYDLNAPIENETAENSGEDDYEDFSAEEPKAPEF